MEGSLLVPALTIALWAGLALLALPARVAATGGLASGNTNRLIHEKSPYLLQHAHNPVDWYPWGEEALEKARRENKLIFLSIGYSTCHWCHVMERESFEDSEVAALLNASYVAIKVDREERPDLDQVYMRVCQVLTGSGGWPLNVFLTPDRLPFFAGTYFPKESRYGRPGLTTLLRNAQELWQADPAKITAQGSRLVADLGHQDHSGGAAPAVDAAVLATAARQLAGRFDTERGGFGEAPKFPSPHQLTYLLEHHRRVGDPHVLAMVEQTLAAMGGGGIYDQLGFGFHRYSTDAQWLVPHFEKMLYDQAGLATAYLEAYQATGKSAYAQTVREIFTYVARDLTDPEGGFYTAEDADSEGVEGRFYVWTRGEILAALGPEAGAEFARVFEVREEGNFTEPGHPSPDGRNILHRERDLDHWATALEVPVGQLEERLEASRRTLLALRGKRPRPHRDDKILAGWNGLMISALARGGAVLGDAEATRAAARAANFVLTRMRDGSRLLRRYRDGEAGIPGFAEDYAFLARGLLDLYQATAEPEHLRQALGLAGQLFERFAGADGGLYDTPSDGEELVFRPRDVGDGAHPSAHSVALEVTARLALLTGDLAWRERADRLLSAYAEKLHSYPAALTHLLRAAALLIHPTREVVVSGDPAAADTLALLAAVAQSYAPETSSLLVPAQGREAIEALAPFVVGMKPVGGRAAAYTCQNFTCQEPTTDPATLVERLRRPPPAPAAR
ncbi:MAG TPA: thioredoxin domain-containing protein [Deferrisomatales bacterium]|nr:thioredoxin domain-containing protein [Deferrisomatales bacterium]